MKKHRINFMFDTILYLLPGRELSHRFIGKMAGVSDSYIVEIEKRAMRKIREM